MRISNTAFKNFYVNFLNNDSLVNIGPITIKFLGDVLNNILEGSMSQNLDLGPDYLFMLCRHF